jgi:hypothetical protein
VAQRAAYAAAALDASLVLVDAAGRCTSRLGVSRCRRRVHNKRCQWWLSRRRPGRRPQRLELVAAGQASGARFDGRPEFGFAWGGSFGALFRLEDLSEPVAGRGALRSGFEGSEAGSTPIERRGGLEAEAVGGFVGCCGRPCERVWVVHDVHLGRERRRVGRDGGGPFVGASERE